MVLQAGLAALLTRLGSGTDITLGTPVAGRPDDRLDDLVGFFVNSLTLRTDTSGDPTFRELLHRVREFDLAAYVHQDVPFDLLVDALSPERTLARHPLFQVVIAFTGHSAHPGLSLPGLGVTREPVETRAARFDLSLYLSERRDADGSPAGVDGIAEYSTDLFDPATAERLTRVLVRLLTAVTADPGLRIGDVDLLGEDELFQAPDRKALRGPTQAAGTAADTSTAVGGQEPATPAEHILATLFRELLNLPEVPLDEDFFALGGDSISSIRLVSRAAEAGVVISARDVFRHQTVQELAAVARGPVGGASLASAHVTGGGSALVHDPDNGTGPVPLTPVMRWLLERGGPIGRFSQSVLLTVPETADPPLLTDALQALLDHHDMLRSRLVTEAELDVRPVGTVRAADLLDRRDVSATDDLHAAVAEEFDRVVGLLDPAAGAMVRAVWFDAGPERPGRLLLVVHHLAVDGVSWRILVPDLEAAWTAVAAARQPNCPRWARRSAAGPRC